MSEFTTGAAQDATHTAGADRAEESAESGTAGDQRSDGTTNGAAASGATPRRRRRGRRGGRGRSRGGGGGAGAGATGAAEERVPESEYDAAADRGLTDDDVAAVAAEEAGLVPPGGHATPARPKVGDTRPAPRPQIGDTRPAPPSQPGDGEPRKRRRRRGGRGRSRGGGGGGGGPAPTTTVVEGGLGVGDVDVDGATILESLDEKTLERRLGSTRKGRPAGRYLMVVHVHDNGVSQLSVLEGRNLVEHYVSRPTDDETSIDGNIYLGRVQNVLPGMEAAFVDIGTAKNAVLYRADVSYDEAEFEGERPRIERVLGNGQSVLVQVTKNPIAHKGARLTQEVSLAGRFVVMVPGQPKTYGISKRLPDDERRRLRRVLDRVRPDDAGLIVRTAAEGATEDELQRDMNRLKEQWRRIEELAKRSKPGSLLYREPPLVVRVIREEFTKEYRGVVIDDRALYEEVRAYVGAVSPELADRVEFFDPAEENLPVFEKFHIVEQLHKATDRKVWLPSGGSIVIEPTEALTVIDVNTGKNVGRSNLEDTVFRNNLEAADVIARELRLRDIGGIIVVDFIDMEIEENRRKVEAGFREALARDKTRTQVFSISELGLLQMTRKRIGEGMIEALSQPCETCRGHGFVLDESLLSS